MNDSSVNRAGGDKDQNSTDQLPINFFRPRSTFLRREVLLIVVMLLLWGVGIFGFQFLLMTDYFAEGSLLGFPIHFWYTGQFLVLFFLVLCVLFNWLLDRLEDWAVRRGSKRHLPKKVGGLRW